MTVLAADGTQEVDVPERLQTAPAIDERQVVEAVQLTLELERRFGWPVDVECAWEKEILYVLQCRPITTLQERRHRGLWLPCALDRLFRALTLVTKPSLAAHGVFEARVASP